jgi:hypothetical protein
MRKLPARRAPVKVRRERTANLWEKGSVPDAFHRRDSLPDNHPRRQRRVRFLEQEEPTWT